MPSRRRRPTLRHDMMANCDAAATGGNPAGQGKRGGCMRRILVLLGSVVLMLAVSGSIAAAGKPGAVSGAAAKPPDTKVAGIDVDATTIPELQELMSARRMKSVQLTQFYLHRIQKLNPTLNAVITVSPTALADARAADAARRDGDDRPLLGIPIIVKDNVNTTGMPTTAGSWALAGSMPSDAFIAARLKAAGAIIIGKANLSEWANFRSDPSSSGWSGIGGPDQHAVCPRSQPVRLELRFGRRRGSRPGGGRGRHGDRRLDRLPVGRQRRRRHQAHARALEPRRRRPDQRRPGHGRPDGPQRDRCGRSPRRGDRRRPERRGDVRSDRPRLHRLHAIPRRRGPRRRSHRRLAGRNVRPLHGRHRRTDPGRYDRRARSRGRHRDRGDRHRSLGNCRRVRCAPV